MVIIMQVQDEIIEADDGIAYYCSKIKDDEKIVIVTNDRDMLQLLHERIGVYVINLRKIVTIKNYNENFNHHYSNIKLLKILSGDNSDNIKGIKGVSEKTLINYIKKQLENPMESLYKISLCWNCNEDMVNKYKTIKESVNKNAKYFFEKGKLDV